MRPENVNTARGVIAGLVLSFGCWLAIALAIWTAWSLA